MTSGKELKRFNLSAALFGAFVLMAGCANPVTRGIGNVFSGDAKAEREAEEAREQEDRISILALDEELTVDPRYADAPVNLPPAYKNASWPQPGGEPDHTLHHLSAPLTFEKIWTADVGSASAKRARLTSPPIIVGDRVYVLDAAARVSAFEFETGELIWRKALTPDIKERFRVRDLLSRPKAAQIGFGGGVAYDEGRVFVTSGFGFAAAIDAISGEELWRVQTDSAVRTPPTAYRGRVYFTTNTNEFITLNQETGKKEWTFQSFVEAARILSSASPAAAGDLVVAPFSSGELVAFMAESGRMLWTETLSRGAQLTALASLNDIAGSPVIDRGLVFAVSHAGKLEAIDIRSGQPVWVSPIASLQTPWVAGDYIFVVSTEAELVCISRADGGIVWISQLKRYEKEKKKKGRITWAGPVLAGDHLLLVSSDGEMVKVSPADGSVVTTQKIGNTVIAPIVANEVVLVLTEAGKLVAWR